MKGKIKHLKNKFSIASYELIRECSAEELKFYLWLKLWAINKGSAWPGIEKIKDEFGFKSRRGVEKMIQRIEKEGLLNVKRRKGKTNIYDITAYDCLVNKSSQGYEQQFGGGGEQKFARTNRNKTNKKNYYKKNKKNRGKPVDSTDDMTSEEIARITQH